MVDCPNTFRSSWADRFTTWIERSVIPDWLIYFLMASALFAIALSGLWLGGVPLTNKLLAYYGLSAFSPAYLLGLIHFLDRSASTALARFRPVLTVDNTGYEDLHCKLTTMPARGAMVASTLGAVYGLAAILTNQFAGNYPGPGILLPGIMAMNLAFQVLITALAALLVYHTFYQLRMVNLIYTRHTQINLFHQGPLYALSGLAARTAIGISLITYLWFWLNSSDTRGIPLVGLVLLLLMAAIVLVTFIWPLLGAHRLLEKEKQRLLSEVSRRIELTITVLHQAIDNGEVSSERGALKDTLDGLVVEQGVIQKLRTWPWRTETASSVGAAFLLPLFSWLLQRILQRIGI